MKYFSNELVLNPKIVELVEICLHALQGANCTYALYLYHKMSHMHYNNLLYNCLGYLYGLLAHP